MKALIFFLVIVFLSSNLLAESEHTLFLHQGYNEVIIEEYFPAVLVSQLVSAYPQIQSITLREEHRQLGYLNLLGGIGTNFFFEPQKTYEIYVREDLTFLLYG